MVLFLIGESIGWQELFLIGTLALIFLGPRKLPQLAKTIGKTMAEFRNAGQEFRNTWEKEISLEDEEKSFLRDPLDENLAEAEINYDKQNKSIRANSVKMPEIRQVSEKDFPQLAKEKSVRETPLAESVGKQDWF